MPRPTAIAATIAALALALAAPAPAHAQRPVLAGEAKYGALGGGVLVHYATTGADAAPAADANTNGFPDFVESVSAIAEAALTQLVGLGFRAPLPDGTLGDDARTDIYLQDLVSADGHAGIDSCTENRCVGHVIAENDYAGYNYPSVTEGIKSVVPHELFHLIQNAYAGEQPGSWQEGSAVWAVEQLYGDGNGDFERFLPSFLTRSFRPFERSVAGFGDAYTYGAALWPYFLSHRFDPTLIVDSWKACETAEFLDAIDAALAPRGSSVEDAFIEFTRWNLFTGPRAAGGGYPDASRWAKVPQEPATDGAARIFIEGMSARYLPITVGANPRVAVRPPGNIRVAAWIVPDSGGLGDGIELTKHDGVHAATVPPGSYTLVVTGLSRNTIATAVEVELTPPVDDDDGGCNAGGGRGASWIALLGVICVARRRRRRRSA
jgi:hypothetical protein